MKIIWAGVLTAGLAICSTGSPSGQAAGQKLTAVSMTAMDGKEMIAAVVEHENDASTKRGAYTYLSVEKSDRTGGHEWTERVAETAWGKVRYLVAEDGKPLTGDRLAKERARVEDEAARPEVFKQQEAAKGQEEQHARQMMLLLPKAFLFDPPQQEGDLIRIHYRPNPDYSPNGMEERVLHGMSGSVLIDPRMNRTRELQGTLPQDVTFGFGLATVKAGSSFDTTRAHVEGVDWKTMTIHTDINGKALMLKTIARQQDARHTEFKRIPNDMTVADAVKMMESASPDARLN